MSTGRLIRANGIDIHYLEQGAGRPLLLLHGGLVSSSLRWAGVPVSYASHLDTLASRFRVIAPDTRGCARTAHTGGEAISFALLADDVAALIDALGLERPLVAGFSEGAITATILAIRKPESVAALVNHAGHDFFNPQAKSFPIMRQLFGGSADASRTDPDAVERFFAQSEPMRGMFELMKQDQDEARGAGLLAHLPRAGLRPHDPLARLRLRRPGENRSADLDSLRRPRRVLLRRGGRHRLPDAPRPASWRSCRTPAI